jgi:predicted ester cyclase
MTSQIVQKNKAIVWEFWQKLNDSEPGGAVNVIQSYVHKEISWHGPHPINNLKGVDALIKGFWQPLLKSFPDLRRKCDIFIGGHVHWVGAIGYFTGTFSHDWLGIPASHCETHIRFGEFSAVYDGKIIMTYIIPDVLDVMRQAGFQLVPPSLGEEGLLPAPMTGDGVLLTTQVDEEGNKTLSLAKTMCGALDTPECEGFWDSDRMMWYGPCGIGALRTYKKFEDDHCVPFRHAFPGYGTLFGGVHVAEVGEGNYAGWVGWPSIRGIHGGEYLGCPPTGNLFEWRLMDFYRREGDRIIENWVPVDMIHLFLTMGVDLFEKMRGQINPKREKRF